HYFDSRNNILAHVLVLADLRQVRELLSVTEERNKLQATISTITDGIIGISDQSEISLINNGLEAMFHISKDQLQYKQIHDVFKFQTESQIIDIPAELAKMKAGQQVQFTDVVATTSHDRTLDINLFISKLSHESKVDLMAIITVQNVSKERQLQKM